MKYLKFEIFNSLFTKKISRIKKFIRCALKLFHVQVKLGFHLQYISVRRTVKIVMLSLVYKCMK